jgi:hypothetical protein
MVVDRLGHRAIGGSLPGGIGYPHSAERRERRWSGNVIPYGDL